MTHLETSSSGVSPALPNAPVLKLEERLTRLSKQNSRPLTPQEFVSGTQCIKDREGNPVIARVIPASSSDAEQILHWYEPDTSDQPTYADDPKWKEWWCDVLRGKFEGIEAVKLCIPGSDQALAFLALKEVKDWMDGGAPTLYVNGLRINPNLMPKDVGARLYSGTGTALISFAIIESLKRGLSGIGLNSSRGVESFYRGLGLDEKIGFDGKRSYFFLKGPDKLFSFAEQRYASFSSGISQG